VLMGIKGGRGGGRGWRGKELGATKGREGVCDLRFGRLGKV